MSHVRHIGQLHWTWSTRTFIPKLRTHKRSVNPTPDAFLRLISRAYPSLRNASHESRDGSLVLTR